MNQIKTHGMEWTRHVVTLILFGCLPLCVVAQCLPTGSDIEGPYYIPGAPQTDSIIAPVLQSNAQKIWVRGTVYFNGCKVPVPNPVLDIWHTNELGEYSNVDGNPNDFAYRAKVQGDADGSYRYYSVMPGLYPGRPKHTHFKVWVNDTLKLTSQMYFAGDSLNAQDPWASIAEPNRVVELDTLPNGDLEARFDIYTIDDPWTGTTQPDPTHFGIMHVWPNPMDGGGMLYLPEPMNVTLTDIMGRTIIQSRENDRIDVRHLSPGVYQLISEEGQGARVVIPSR